MSTDARAPEYKDADRRTAQATQTGARPVVSKESARQAVTGHGVRYVLGFGLLAVIVAFAIIYGVYFA